MLSEKEYQEPDYFAVVKLTNNENIIGGIFIDDDESGIHIQDPLLVKQLSMVSDGVMLQKYMLTPWMIHSSDTKFYIDGYHIVSHGEMSATMFQEYINYISSDAYGSFYTNDVDAEYQEEDVSIDKPLFDTVQLSDIKNTFQKLYEQPNTEI